MSEDQLQALVCDDLELNALGFRCGAVCSRPPRRAVTHDGVHDLQACVTARTVLRICRPPARVACPPVVIEWLDSSMPAESDLLGLLGDLTVGPFPYPFDRRAHHRRALLFDLRPLADHCEQDAIPMRPPGVANAHEKALRISQLECTPRHRWIQARSRTAMSTASRGIPVSFSDQRQHAVQPRWIPCAAIGRERNRT